MSDQADMKLLLELDPEAARWRRRTMFLVSVIFHGCLIAFILFSPQLFKRGAEIMGIDLRAAPKKETTYLWLPPDVLKSLREPPESRILSDKNRRAQGRSPVIDPNGLRMPYSRGNTPLPELAGGGQPLPPPPAPSTPPAGGAASPPSPASPPAPKKENAEEARLRLMDVQPQSSGGQGSRLNLPELTSPGAAIQHAAQAAGSGRYGSGSVPGPGDSVDQLQNLHPNFSTEAPQILSDTMGVDFGPYLARVVYTVRRNWYQVIPESARLGEKGRVGIVFEILKDGSVPQIRLVAGSGAEALDRAALAGIRASIPFPPLPEEFKGNHLVLQFIFLYNLTYNAP